MITISCFSYKGGAGRSTLAMNIVPFLADALGATEEKPLILVDMDIDSCGITYFLDIKKFSQETMDKFSVQALFGTNGAPQTDLYAESAKDHVLFSHLRGVGQFFHRPERSILCLPAQPGASLGANNSNYDSSRSGNLEKFLKECNEWDICGVLLDSAVGDQLTAKWSNNAADIILCCLRPTEQFREGTSRFFDNFDKNIAQHKKIIIVPNVVPTEPLTIQEEEGQMHYPDHAKEEILKAFQDNIESGKNEYCMDMLKGNLFGVPKVDRFMWHESVLVNASDLTKSEEEALKSYQAIVETIKSIGFKDE